MTPPKPKRWSFWLVSATALLSIGAWQAAQITLDEKNRAMSAVKAPPKKTRSDGRKPSAKELAVADPVAVYQERARRGTSEQQFRWILEDFHTLGLDREPTPGTFAELRKHQATWYLDALAEGLSLSHPQKEQAKAKLREIRETGDKAYGAQADEPDPVNSFAAEEYGWQLGERASDYVVAKSWLGPWKTDPWDLCDLTTEQQLLTYRSNPSARGFAHDPGTNRWLPPPNAELAPMGDALTMPDIFPFMPSQQLPADQGFGNNFAKAKRLQPAQLRVILLLNPDLAEGFQAALDFPKTPATPDRLELPSSVQPPVATDPSTPQTSPR